VTAPLVVLVNEGSGGGKAAEHAERIRKRLDGAGRPARVIVGDGKTLSHEARRALEERCAALVAAGGDGTVSSLAGLVAGTRIPLGVIPVGTLNHFARDLGIPLDVDEAIDVILAGRTLAVDVGQVNGRVFVNNASLGVYPRIVKLRERYRRTGAGKWLALTWASLAVLRRFPFVAVRLEIEGETVVRRTPLVFIGNNEYRMDGLEVGARNSLTDGCLCLYLLNASKRSTLIRLALQVLFGMAQKAHELESRRVRDCTVETRRRHVQIALDGEVLDLKSPLEFETRPGALTVFAPDTGSESR
jgi:YegS/Rv2252/BmrU family lipid kinase